MLYLGMGKNIGVSLFDLQKYLSLKEERNITNAQMARILNTTPMTTLRIGRGITYPSEKHFMAIAKYFKIPAQELLTRPPQTLREYRWLKGLDCAEAATKWGIPPATLHRVENGISPLRPPVAAVLSIRLQIPLEKIEELYQAGFSKETTGETTD